MTDLPPDFPPILPHQSCFVRAAQVYRLPMAILPAIAVVEGGRPGVSSRPNANGTVDHGLMQINTSWAARFQNSFRISPDLLKNDPCVSIMMAGYIVRYEIDNARGDFWTGVGRYHSRTPSRHSRYIVRVHDAAVKMQPHIRWLEYGHEIVLAGLSK